MARYGGDPKSGRVGNLVYRADGVVQSAPVARRRSNSPRVKENNNDFATTSRYVEFFRNNAFVLMPIRDSRQRSRLFRSVRLALNSDGANPKGSKRLDRSLGIFIFQDFQLNANATFESLFGGSVSFSGYGVELKNALGNPYTGLDARAPSEATHLEFTSVVVGFDLKPDEPMVSAIAQQGSTGKVPLDSTASPNPGLGPSDPAGTVVHVAIVGLQFFQEDASRYYLLNNVKYKGAKVVFAG
ncbi:MAG: hypothetical protein GDA43_08095 [Hormoscilla sp. SP5CHS1]|nr:hypothetical protein [Hormoscilla sp. SP5CHS1]